MSGKLTGELSFFPLLIQYLQWHFCVSPDTDDLFRGTVSNAGWLNFTFLLKSNFLTGNI